MIQVYTRVVKDWILTIFIMLHLVLGFKSDLQGDLMERPSPAAEGSWHGNQNPDKNSLEFGLSNSPQQSPCIMNEEEPTKFNTNNEYSSSYGTHVNKQEPCPI